MRTRNQLGEETPFQETNPRDYLEFPTDWPHATAILISQTNAAAATTLTRARAFNKKSPCARSIEERPAASGLQPAPRLTVVPVAPARIIPFAFAWTYDGAELHLLVSAIQRPFCVERNAIPDLLSWASGSNNARHNASSP